MTYVFQFEVTVEKLEYLTPAVQHLLRAAGEYFKSLPKPKDCQFQFEVIDLGVKQE